MFNNTDFSKNGDTMETIFAKAFGMMPSVQQPVEPGVAVADSLAVPVEAPVAPGVTAINSPLKKVSPAPVQRSQQLIGEVKDKGSIVSEVREKDRFGNELLVKSIPFKEPTQTMEGMQKQDSSLQLQGTEAPGFMDRFSEYLQSPAGSVLLGQIGKAFAGNNPVLQQLGQTAIDMGQNQGLANAQKAIDEGRVPDLRGLSADQIEGVRQSIEKSQLLDFKRKQELYDVATDIRDYKAKMEQQDVENMTEAAKLELSQKRLQLDKDIADTRQKWYEAQIAGTPSYEDLFKHQTRLKLLQNALSDTDRTKLTEEQRKVQRENRAMEDHISSRVAQSLAGEFGEQAGLQATDTGYILTTSNRAIQDVYEAQIAVEVYREQLQGTMSRTWLGYSVKNPMPIEAYEAILNRAVHSKNAALTSDKAAQMMIEYEDLLNATRTK